MFFAMIRPLQEVPGFDTGTRRALARTSGAVAALFTAGALSLSLLIAIAMLSLDVLRAPAGLVL